MLFVALVTVLVPALSSTALSAEETTRSAAVGVLADFPPHYSLDPEGRPTGFAIDLFDAIARDAGVTYHYQVFDTWAALLDALDDGAIDVIPNLGITGPRRRFASFTVPTEVFSISVFVRANSEYLELADLSGHTVGVVSANAAIPLLQAQAVYRLREFPHFTEALHALLAGRVEAVAYPAPVVRSTAMEFGIARRLRKVEPPLAEIKRAIAVAKGREDLLESLDRAAEALVGSERYGEVYSKWFAQPEPYWTPKRVLLVFLGGLVLSAAVSFLLRYQRITRLVEQLTVEKERFHIVADYTYDWEMWVDAFDRLVYVSPSCERITGYTAEEFVQDPELRFRVVHPDDREAFRALDDACHRTRAPAGTVYRMITRAGEQRWIEHRRLPVSRPARGRTARAFCRDGDCGYRISNRDITDRKVAEEDIAFYATHDALTRLPNRYLLLDRLQGALAVARRNDTKVALLYIDLDNFKPINDAFGHAAGDQTLQAVAARLQASIRQSDTAARIGGDEFVVILPNLTDLEAVSTVTDQLHRTLSEPYPLDGGQANVGVSIGVALFPDDADGSDQLLNSADTALYAVKGGGKGGVRYVSSRGPAPVPPP